MQETEKITYRTGTIAPPPEYEPVTASTDERFKQYVTKSEQPQEPVSEEERRDAEEYFESRGENGDGADNRTRDRAVFGRRGRYDISGKRAGVQI